MTKRQILAWLAAGMISACHSTPPTTPAKPAQLHATNSDACYQQLQTLLSQAVHAPVTISSKVFQDSARLYLDNKSLRDEAGQRKDGLLTGKPWLFELQNLNNQCLLINRKTGWQSPLTACICQTI